MKKIRKPKKFLLLKTYKENTKYNLIPDPKDDLIDVFYLFTERCNSLNELMKKNKDYIYSLSDEKYSYLKKNYSISKISRLTKKQFFSEIKLEEFLI